MCHVNQEQRRHKVAMSMNRKHLDISSFCYFHLFAVHSLLSRMVWNAKQEMTLRSLMASSLYFDFDARVWAAAVANLLKRACMFQREMNSRDCARSIAGESYAAIQQRRVCLRWYIYTGFQSVAFVMNSCSVWQTQAVTCDLRRWQRDKAVYAHTLAPVGQCRNTVHQVTSF